MAVGKEHAETQEKDQGGRDGGDQLNRCESSIVVKARGFRRPEAGISRTISFPCFLG